MRRKIIVHPLFFGLFPVLFLYANNINQVAFSETLLPIGLVLLMTGLMLLLARFVLKNDQKAAMIVSIFLILCFSYGHVFEIISGWTRASFIIQRGRYLMGFWGLLFLSGFWLTMRTKRELINQASLFNIISLSLVLISLVNIGAYKVKTWLLQQDGQKPFTLEIDSSRVTGDKIPDIYYLVFDRYARADTLKEVYGYDNQEFLDYLSSKGFYVALESQANYMTTHHSLASSLNMEYLDSLSEKYKDSDNFLPLFRLLEDHQVGRFLKAGGYKYFHFGSYYQPTLRNRNADVNVNWHPLPEFLATLYKTTIFYPIGLELRVFDFRLTQWQRVQYKFDKLAEMTKIEGPKFVFAHFMTPHGPFVFDKNGEFLTEEEEDKRSPQENYVDQIIFLNKKIKVLLETLLADSDNPPIIILQADEGKYPSRYWQDPDNFNWQEATQTELKEKMGILNVYFLSNVEEEVLYSSISPVNSFRVIFNLYFGANLELLPDKHYVNQDARHLYKFINVTEEIK